MQIKNRNSFTDFILGFQSFLIVEESLCNIFHDRNRKEHPLATFEFFRRSHVSYQIYFSSFSGSTTIFVILYINQNFIAQKKLYFFDIYLKNISFQTKIIFKFMIFH